MKPDEKLDTYLRRIGYEGPRTASLEVLKELHLLHPKTFPFENLNPYLGIPVELDLESLRQKMIDKGRGGYCFEQNLLFKSVIEALGFKVKGLAARVLWNQPEGRVTPRGHMLLLIELDGKNYVADVGFGGLTLTTPLLLEPDLVQETPHEPYRLLRLDEDAYVMEVRVKDEWKSIYRFDLQEQFLPDYEVTNWYLSHHPESHFVTGLIAARAEVNPRRRFVLRNNQFSIHYLDGETEKHMLETTAELRETLEQHFHITLPEAEGMDKALDKVIEREVMLEDQENTQ